MSRVRLVPIVLIVVVTLGVLIAGFKAYEHFNLVTPLQTRIEQNSAVQSATVEVGNPSIIRLVLKPVDKLNNRDLQTTYLNLVNAVESLTGRNANLVIEDRRDATLTSDYEQLEPVLLSGLRKGNYTQMLANFGRQATQDGIYSRVTIDQHHVYVQLWTGSHYLYDILGPFSNLGYTAN